MEHMHMIVSVCLVSTGVSLVRQTARDPLVHKATAIIGIVAFHCGVVTYLLAFALDAATDRGNGEHFLDATGSESSVRALWGPRLDPLIRRLSESVSEAETCEQEPSDVKQRVKFLRAFCIEERCKFRRFLALWGTFQQYNDITARRQTAANRPTSSDNAKARYEAKHAAASRQLNTWAACLDGLANHISGLRKQLDLQKQRSRAAKKARSGRAVTATLGQGDSSVNYLGRLHGAGDDSGSTDLSCPSGSEFRGLNTLQKMEIQFAATKRDCQLAKKRVNRISRILSSRSLAAPIPSDTPPATGPRTPQRDSITPLQLKLATDHYISLCQRKIQLREEVKTLRIEERVAQPVRYVMETESDGADAVLSRFTRLGIHVSENERAIPWTKRESFRGLRQHGGVDASMDGASSSVRSTPQLLHSPSDEKLRQVEDTLQENEDDTVFFEADGNQRSAEPAELSGTPDPQVTSHSLCSTSEAGRFKVAFPALSSSDIVQAQSACDFIGSGTETVVPDAKIPRLASKLVHCSVRGKDVQHSHHQKSCPPTGCRLTLQAPKRKQMRGCGREIRRLTTSASDRTAVKPPGRTTSQQLPCLHVPMLSSNAEATEIRSLPTSQTDTVPPISRAPSPGPAVETGGRPFPSQLSFFLKGRQIPFKGAPS